MFPNQQTYLFINMCDLSWLHKENTPSNVKTSPHREPAGKKIDRSFLVISQSSPTVIYSSLLLCTTETLNKLVIIDAKLIGRYDQLRSIRSIADVSRMT